MKKKKIVIATHGSLAQGFLSSLSIIVGNVENVDTICGYLTPEFDLDQEIGKCMQAFDPETEDLIVFTDVFGGSVNNALMQYQRKYPFHLITNTNLGILIDILLTMNEVNAENIRKKIAASDCSTIYCNDVWQKMEETIDDL